MTERQSCLYVILECDSAISEVDWALWCQLETWRTLIQSGSLTGAAHELAWDLVSSQLISTFIFFVGSRVKVTVIGHWYSALLWVELIARALKYGPC